MLNQFLSQPIVLRVEEALSCTLTLSPQCSDFTVLEALSTPFAELVVTECAQQASSLILRLPPFIHFEASPHPLANPCHEVCALDRTLGQGFRLYPHMSSSPKYFIELLRSGVTLNIFVRNHKLCVTLMLLSQFELVPLESDLRLFLGPKVMLKAKALVARSYDYSKGPEMLALHRGEIELVRTELKQYIENYKGSHSGLFAEVERLQLQLREKSQWLQRLYNQAIERNSLSVSANVDLEAMDSDKLTRSLEYYRLLAPAGVSDLVTKLMEEH